MSCKNSNRILLSFAAQVLLVICVAPSLQAATVTDPAFVWQYFEIPSDGAGGVGPAHRVDGGVRTGGLLDETHQIQPPAPFETTIEHLQVYSEPTGRTFWASAKAPVGTQILAPSGETVGGRADLFIAQKFIKETNDNPTFTISAASLNVFGPPPPPDPLGHPLGVGFLSARLHFLVAAFNPNDPSDTYHFFSYETTLDGKPTDYRLAEFGYRGKSSDSNDPDSEFVTGDFDYGITYGALGDVGVGYGLGSPYVGEIDLSDVQIGETYVLAYQLIAEAIDTWQADSRAEAFGRDPLDFNSGISIDPNGSTPLGPYFPVGVPEPGSNATLFSALVLYAARRRRRS